MGQINEFEFHLWNIYHEQTRLRSAFKSSAPQTRTHLVLRTSLFCQPPAHHLHLPRVQVGGRRRRHGKLDLLSLLGLHFDLGWHRSIHVSGSWGVWLPVERRGHWQRSLHLPGRSSHYWVVPLLSPCPLSLSLCLLLSLSLTFVAKKLRTLVLSPVPAVAYIQHLPLFSLFLPSLTTRAAGLNEASLDLVWREREVGGQSVGEWPISNKGGVCWKGGVATSQRNGLGVFFCLSRLMLICYQKKK